MYYIFVLFGNKVTNIKTYILDKIIQLHEVSYKISLINQITKNHNSCTLRELSNNFILRLKIECIFKNRKLLKAKASVEWFWDLCTYISHDVR